MELPKPVWKKVEEKAQEVNANIDAKADSFLDKAKSSKLTWVILGGGGAVMIVALMLAIIF